MIIGAKSESYSNPESTNTITKSDTVAKSGLSAKFHKIILQLQNSSPLGAMRAAKVWKKPFPARKLFNDLTHLVIVFQGN